jgi:hypothetical protein
LPTTANSSQKKPKKSNQRPLERTATAAASATASDESKASPAPRPLRIIVIGAGISGLACARELSERRHDVLVLEARGRIGGRLRTVDLMTERPQCSSCDNRDNRRDSCCNEERVQNGGGISELSRVKGWSPVDVGGAFIHGTGRRTTRTDDDDAGIYNVGSHDFGTSKSKQQKSKQQPAEAKRLRKSSRLSIDYNQKTKGTDNSKFANHKHLNPIYVLAHRKLRLPSIAAEGAFTCLVDHEGNLISQEMDEEVSREFNEVLDLAANCCESGLVPVIGEDTNSPRQVKESGGASPNCVSDDTPDNGANREEDGKPRNTANWQKIDPDTDFGTIFSHCRRYHAASNAKRSFSVKEMQVRQQLFQWHVANLEMSSGASMDRLGQRWNDDGEYYLGSG